MSPDEVAKVAGVREAVRAAPRSWFNLPAWHPTAIALREAALVTGYRHQYADRYSMCLNTRGLAVKAYLENER